MPHRLFLIGYDINDEASRHRALRILRANSIGYQGSVFEVPATPEQISVLLAGLQVLLENDDRLFCTPLHSRHACWQLGTGDMTPTGDFLLIT